MYDIFLSYRRDGGHEMARLLYEHLRLKGLNCFFDLEELGSGEFNVKLLDSIEDSKNFILILSPGALDRCQNDGDWVRCEIEHAIKCEKNIVPLMLPGYEWPDNLPESLAKLPFYNGVQLVREYFDASLDKLIDMLELDSEPEDNTLQEQAYQAAVLGMKTAKKKKQFEKLAEIFISLGLYKDSVEKTKECYALAQKAAGRRRLKIFIAVCTTIFALAAAACIWAYKQVQEDNLHTHAFGGWETTKEASCLEDGMRVRRCACLEQESETIPATGHSFGAWITVKEATDTEDGKKVRTCACGEQETETIPATQSGGGNVSGNGNQSSHTHAFDQKNTATKYLKSNATCKSPAQYYYSCTCGEIGASVFTHGTLGEHEYDQKNTDTAYRKSQATETFPAVYYYSCICGEKGTATFTSGGTLDHVHNFNQENTETSYRKSTATCTDVAVYYYSCTCGEKGTSTFVSGSVIAHSFSEWVLDKAATCVSTGTRHHVCTVCNKSVSETIPVNPTAHKYATAWTTDNSNHWHKCQNSGCTSIADKTTHAFGEWIVDTAATCMTTGTKHHVCTVCNKSVSETIPVNPAAHNYATAGMADATHHWHACQNSGCTSVSDKEAHIGTTCSACSYVSALGNSTYIRVDAEGKKDANGSCILFGEYPQTLKVEGVTVGTTTDSRGYYLGSDGSYYAKVTAEPDLSKFTFQSGASVTKGNVYYFKVEPIRWRILSESGDTVLILCDSIIANKRFDDNKNNYKDSEIRAWLNAEFYNTAFSALQKALINTVLVDNSIASTGYSPNAYACEDTNDKIFLLSYKEATDPDYGFASSNSTQNTVRRVTVSDYARATGAYMDTSNYYGNGFWWLRSPGYEDDDQTRYVYYDGRIAYDTYVYFDSLGVVPALQIRLN